MPRLLACNICRILERAPDPHPKTPMIPARIVWENGQDYVYKDEDGHALMVPAFDPVLEDFVVRHGHQRPDIEFLDGSGHIKVWAVDQRTWDSIDLVTQVKNELQQQTGTWYEDRDHYRTGATECYIEHGRPTLKDGCSDFMDDSKMIGKGRYEVEGKPVNIPDKFRQYLCHQCPYMHGYILPELRIKAGLAK